MATLRYRVRDDRLEVDLEGYVPNERMVWAALKRGCPALAEEKDPLGLRPKRVVPVKQASLLVRAAKGGGHTLAPAPGEPPLEKLVPQRKPYPEVRPFRVEDVLEQAAADEDPEAVLTRAYDDLFAWKRKNPDHDAPAKDDLRRISSELKRRREARAREEAQDPEERAISERLVGVSGEHVLRARDLLRAMRDEARSLEADAQAQERPPVEVPDPIPGFRGKLRTYQREGVEFLASRNLNAVLADEMGLGKTVQTIAAVLAADERAFVVCPANVLYNWADEVQRFTGERALIWHRQQWIGPRDARFLLTTYDAVQRFPWKDSDVADRPVLILDEAHYVRNPDTLRARFVKNLPQRRRVLLTGTPVVNGLEDYYELLTHTGNAKWGDVEEFRATWLADRELFERYRQVREATAGLLQRATADVVLRRLKDQVLTELPPRTIRVLRHDLPDGARKEYDRMERAMAEAVRQKKSDVEVFAHLNGLRHHLAKARVPAVQARVEEILEAGENVVVFSHYLEPLRRLGEALGDRARTLSGATPPRERLEIARHLGKPGKHRVVLAQVEAGGVGLNLVGAANVLFVHLGWTPAVHRQAIDRVHRIGQDRPVLVDFFVTPGTLDERVSDIVLRKEAEANLALAEEQDVLNRGELAKVLAAEAGKRAPES